MIFVRSHCASPIVNEVLSETFDEKAPNYSQIDFNGLYSLLATIAEEQKKISPVSDREEFLIKQVNTLQKENQELQADQQELIRLRRQVNPTRRGRGSRGGK